MNIISRKPTVQKINPAEIKALKYIDYFLLALMFFASAHIMFFYIVSIFKDIPESVSVKYAVYIVIGCFFVLIAYNKELKEKFGYLIYGYCPEDKTK